MPPILASFCCLWLKVPIKVRTSVSKFLHIDWIYSWFLAADFNANSTGEISLVSSIWCSETKTSNWITYLLATFMLSNTNTIITLRPVACKHLHAPTCTLLQLHTAAHGAFCLLPRSVAPKKQRTMKKKKKNLHSRAWVTSLWQHVSRYIP